MEGWRMGPGGTSGCYQKEREAPGQEQLVGSLHRVEHGGRDGGGGEVCAMELKESKVVAVALAVC